MPTRASTRASKESKDSTKIKEAGVSKKKLEKGQVKSGRVIKAKLPVPNATKPSRPGTNKRMSPAPAAASKPKKPRGKDPLPKHAVQVITGRTLEHDAELLDEAVAKIPLERRILALEAALGRHRAPVPAGAAVAALGAAAGPATAAPAAATVLLPLPPPPPQPSAPSAAAPASRRSLRKGRQAREELLPPPPPPPLVQPTPQYILLYVV